MEKNAFDAVLALQQTLFGDGARSKAHYINMLDFNKNKKIQKAWGPTEYSITFARRKKNEIVGAAMYLTIATPETIQRKYGYHATIAADYIFVSDQERGQGIGAKLMERRAAHAQDFLVSIGRLKSNESPRLMIFNEFENPLALTVAEYHDTENTAKISPLNRAVHWYNTGFRSLEVPYVETEAADGTPACHHYTLNALVGNRSEPIRVWTQ